MRLLRSWPFQVPPGRAHVVDSVERLVVGGFDYQPLSETSDDILLLEWDIAIAREDLERFADYARDEPDRVLVAPYRLYAPDTQRPFWAHRRWDGGPMGMHTPVGAEPVADGEPFCNLWGLGMVYLPREVMRAFFAQAHNHAGDVEISTWHYRNVSEKVPIAWDVRPIHLHYRIEGLVT